MAQKALLIDTSLCMGCRGCQVACKQWWGQGIDATTQTGTYQNPPDLNWKTWSLLRFTELEDADGLRWNFVKDQCRHCDPAPCAMMCPKGAITRDDATGAVLIDQTLCGDCALECITACPFDVPKPELNEAGEELCRVFKCRLCHDRIAGGKAPACATTCPTGAISFGDKDEIAALAQARVDALTAGGVANAQIYPDAPGNVFWVLQEGKEAYSMASAEPGGNGVQKEQDKELEEEKTKPRFTWTDLLKPFGFIGLIGAVAYALEKEQDEAEE